MPKNKDLNLQTLPVFEYRGRIVADSRDVARMIGRQHAHVMRTINTMYGHLSQSNFGLADFFIKATYMDDQGKPRPCYYLTQMGCEMLANTDEEALRFIRSFLRAAREQHKRDNKRG